MMTDRRNPRVGNKMPYRATDPEIQIMIRQSHLPIDSSSVLEDMDLRRIKNPKAVEELPAKKESSLDPFLLLFPFYSSEH
jgi:hypothetical protein